MTRATSFMPPKVAVVLLASLLFACGDSGPTEPSGRTPGAYTLRDISDAVGGVSPGRFNDSGEVLTGSSIVGSASTSALPIGCIPRNLNNRSHVLCVLAGNATPDHRATPASYAIWDGRALRPLSGLDTFPSNFLSAWALNDSDAVALTFDGPSFSNPDCVGACGAVWRDGQLTFLPVTGRFATQMNNRLDLLGKTQDWYSMKAWLFEKTTGNVRPIGDMNTDARDLNDQGWVVGTLYGDRWNHRHVAFVSRPEGLTELGTGDANGINDAGEIVGVLDSVAVIWKDGVPSPLTFAASDTSWTVTRAVAINNRGQIVAQADDSAHAKFDRWVILTPIAP